MLQLQLFNVAALHAARRRQQEARLEARQPKERLVAALYASLGELARKSPAIHCFVIERFSAAALPLPIAITLGLVVSRYLLALPLRDVRNLALEGRLLRTWYLFRTRPGVENLYRREVLARISPELLIKLDYELAWTAAHLVRLRVGREACEAYIAFARTLVLATFDAIYCATRALDD